MDIYNHQSARQLGSLVKGGIERRARTPQPPAASAKETTDKEEGLGSMLWSSIMGQAKPHPMRGPQPRAGVRPPAGGPYRQQGVMRHPAMMHRPEMTEYSPLVPLKKAMKHVTPDNMQKAMQWHGILKTFLSKD